MSFKELEEILLEFKGVSLAPHFEKISFRIHNKILLTYQENSNVAVCKLNLEMQEEMIILDPNSFQEVQNKWGKQGWTEINLDTVSHENFKKAIALGYSLLC